ncbi:MAG: TasA family protein [Halococcoides sp.]
MFETRSKLRVVLVGIAAIGLAAALAGAGTMALFSDTEQIEDNRVSAGTLDLAVDGNNGQSTTVLNVSNAKPGDSGTETITLSNEGTIDGYVDVNLSEAANDEGANPEPEPDTGVDGDLGDELEVSLVANGTTVANGTANDIFDGRSVDTDAKIPAGEEAELTLEWEIPKDTGNKIMGDSVTADATIQLDQRPDQ